MLFSGPKQRFSEGAPIQQAAPRQTPGKRAALRQAQGEQAVGK